ncbi:UDP-N-acetylgalactosamine-undecaprenyl-phosphate N-acetylgalactosaminephosphotransferase [Geobacter sp. OR-1]|uniref:TIGR03013 family XrtA/PEP-CTERM system glycosyltransferase n=1 Tax=Geobacter sp. OR-1 TaxID=1266765 RepID=UPI0005427808|nr:TIGR03013 family XrtA/PEP-CTERM system glycosyltransferase [Geobacter sp. OR-1]GAM10603.1 UDP-N-acetylgalactosamine-undecaprenyl-phosphate N-acetylgalactosaminephosphotransferase [Geobacter sp. OR-1]
MTRRFLFSIVCDVVFAFLALYSAYFIRLGFVPQLTKLSSLEFTRIVLFAVVLLFSSFLLEIYSTSPEIGKKEYLIRIILSVAVSFFILTGLFYLTEFQLFGRGVLLISLLIFGLFQFLSHLLGCISTSLPGFVNKVLILGTGPLARQIGNLIAAQNHSYILAGYFNCASEPVMVPYHNIIDSEEGLCAAVRRVGAQKIVVSLSERRGVFPLQEVLSCKLTGIEVVDAPSFYEQMTGKLLLENITPSWFIFSHGFRVTLGLRLIKRITDLLCASFGLLLTLPFFPLIALVIRIDSPGPILFRQTRVGEGEKLFNLYKFRSMRQDAETGTGAVWAKEKDPRVTKVGEFLRKSRIDEIPQLFNVLRGDMSLVGPRPERPEFVRKLTEVIPYYSERHYIKPGVTGWAQVRYPYGASVEDAIEKLRFDLYYIKNISLPFDILIILETIKVVLFRRGAR